MIISEYEKLKSRVVHQIRFNRRLYDYYLSVGVNYLINPDTRELHRVGHGYFAGSCHLKIADLENFIGLINVGTLPIHDLEDGMEVPIYDLQTRDLIGTYRLNKCGHCFPSAS